VASLCGPAPPPPPPPPPGHPWAGRSREACCPQPPRSRGAGEELARVDRATGVVPHADPRSSASPGRVSHARGGCWVVGRRLAGSATADRPRTRLLPDPLCLCVFWCLTGRRQRPAFSAGRPPSLQPASAACVRGALVPALAVCSTRCLGRLARERTAQGQRRWCWPGCGPVVFVRQVRSLLLLACLAGVVSARHGREAAGCRVAVLVRHA